LSLRTGRAIIGSMDVSARELSIDHEDSAPDARYQAGSDRPYMRAAHELTAHELDEQRRLVAASLLLTGA
jgi:hypothetical protein